MLKKFVPVNSSVSPSLNPYEVRTYMGDASSPEWNVEFCVAPNRVCDDEAKPKHTSTIAKVLTLEDEIRLLHKKAKESRFHRDFKKKCQRFDRFTICVMPQRTPNEQKSHKVWRERYLATKYDRNTYVHDGKHKLQKGSSCIQLNSPVGSEEEEEVMMEEQSEEEEGNRPVRPRLASPSCSLDIIYKPPQRLLELTRPKSGRFHNETDPPLLHSDEIPYSSYNPRELQEQFDDQQLARVDLIESLKENDLWTWNIGLQKRESELDRAFIEATIPKLDCNKMELTSYKIPKDLDKTFTIEVVFGHDKISPEEPPKKPPFYKRPKEIACIFVAFVESYRLNADFWKDETIDGIQTTGEKLLKKSASLNYKSTDMDFDIIPTIAEKQACIGLKIHFTGPMKTEPNIYKALSLYFSNFSTAVFCSKNLFLLIWKRCSQTFFIYDPYGRNETCERDFENGVSSLLTVRHIEHLVHLIVNFSEEDMNSEFNLYEIYLQSYGKITNPIPSKPFAKRTRRLWAVVNNTFAIIPAANNGLHQPISGNEHNPSMIVSLLALLYSDIERASLWRMETLDDLIKLGQAQYKTIIKKIKLKKTQHFNVIDLPERFIMGAYKATLHKQAFLYTGQIYNCKNYLDCQLTFNLKQLFAGNAEAALLQIDNSVISLWRDNEYFYVFDPFRRGKAGQVLDPEDFLTKGVGCLHLHTNFDSFCRILYLKALKMRRGGKFFLHGIRVGCIKPLINAFNLRNKYARLRLTYPKFTNEPEPVIKKKEKKNKKKKIDRTYSISAIPNEDIIPEFDDAEVVESLLEQVICEIFHTMEEPKPFRASLYKQAEKVLLRSDKKYLESLKYKVKHGEDPDLVEAYATHQEPPPQALTLEEELQVPSNYETLPDGSWVIFGTSQLPKVDEEIGKVGGLLSGLITIALSAKYKISTWNSDLIEHALESANAFGEEYQNYEYTLDALLSKKIPRIAIGQDIFMLMVLKIINSSAPRTLRQVLLESLIHYNRLMVICIHFSCVIIRRYNFLYMFIGFPCNSVGYRKFSSGPGCMLRFVELDSLIRRIEFGCNPQGCEIVNFVVISLKAVDVTDEPPERFRSMEPYDEQKVYSKEYERYQKMKQKRMDKINYLENELRKEDTRIQTFNKEKQDRITARNLAKEQRRYRRMKKSRKLQTAMGGDQYTGEEEFADEDLGDDFEDEEEEVEEEIEMKHKPGKKLQTELLDEYKPRPILYGYRMRVKDCLFKIQGSSALEGRSEGSPTNIKTCFFASALAILYAILRPLNQWTSQRVDRVLENAKSVYGRVANTQTIPERFIKNLSLEDFVFDLWIKTYEPAGVMGSNVDRQIGRATHKRRYIMLYTANATFAIYRDEYYHLFDPYPSMEILQDEEDEEDEEGGKKKKHCPKNIRRYGERNTASWILFSEINDLVKYIDKRSSYNWQGPDESRLFVLEVVKYQKSAPKTRILQLLTDLSIPMECKISQHGEDESAICAHNETLSWLDLENCLPVWSRLNRRNTAGRYRNSPLTKLKKYDIEIEGRLWSLWGNLHPLAPVFDKGSRGKQYLACCVCACCAARIYKLTDWSPQLLDTIVVSGDLYHRESLANIKRHDYEFSIEDLNLECVLDKIKFTVHLEYVAYGKLYARSTRINMNLAEALMYFFGHYQCGIVQCQKRSLAIGRTIGYNGGYFMFDCQSQDRPLFPKGQGASYILRTKHLQVLLYCIVVTLNIPFYNVPFTIHKVEMLREGASVDENEEEEDGE